MARDCGLSDCVTGVICALIVFVTSSAWSNSKEPPMDTPLLRYTASIDCAKAHQTIDNFGASDCWSMQMDGRR